MKLEDVQSMWAHDSKIDTTDLLVQSAEVPSLHSKYLNLMYSERAILHKLDRKRKVLESTLTEYYSGNIDGKDIGREPFQLDRGTKSTVEKRVANDKEMINYNIAYTNVEEVVTYLKEVLYSVNNRRWDLKNHIDILKFESGS